MQQTNTCPEYKTVQMHNTPLNSPAQANSHEEVFCFLNSTPNAAWAEEVALFLNKTNGNTETAEVVSNIK